MSKLSRRAKDYTIASSLDAVAIAEFAGNLTYVNPSFLKMWGYADENEVLGKPAVEFWQMPERAWKVIKELGTKSSWTGELVAKRKDGTLFEVQTSASIVTDETGKPICMMGSFMDTTERKQAEEVLRESAEQYRIITSTSMDGFAIVDVAGHLLDVNEAYSRMIGYSRDELLKMSVSDIEAMTTPEEIQTQHRKTMAGSQLFESRHRRKDGHIIDVEVSMTFMRQSGQILVFLRDITERKRAEEQLKNQNIQLEQAVREKQQEMEALFERLLRQEKLATIG